MSLASLAAMDEVYCGNRRIDRIYAGGAQAYERRPKIGDLYGSATGKVTVHLAPQDAVRNAGGNVTAIPNRVPAVTPATFNTTGPGVAQSGRLLTLPASDVFLSSSTNGKPNLVGSRLFMVLAIAPGQSGTVTIAGRSVGSPDGYRTNIRWNIDAAQLELQRWDGAAFQTLVIPGTPLGTGLHVLTVGIAGGQARFWIDGAWQGNAAYVLGNFYVERMFGGFTTPSLTGSGGEIVILASDGSAAMDLPSAIILAELQANYPALPKAPWMGSAARR